MNEQKTTFRQDYRPYSHSIDSVELDFALDPDSTLVKSTMVVTPTRGADTTNLELNGEGLQFESLQINGQEAAPGFYILSDNKLTVKNISRQTKITITNRFSPKANTNLSGIYMSNGAFMSQCEAEGFRHITYWPDRPDVMSRFTVTIHADKALYPVLLSNGNLVGKGDEDDGRHFARWDDPFKKPSYLFALVAGDFVNRSEQFKLANGKECLLQVWTEEKNFDKSAWALESLKKAIRWDEERFGLELDLERFMIVATDDFNFGAMENKGLNIFNSRYVMASPMIATDHDYDAIESVIGHEYFHNWTGDRVTLRDWFQLTLKEGLTVFRDQEFSMDVSGSSSARAVKRIADVRALRNSQFPEDAGPMAHPIRPDSYEEINNFYTMTVYEKGAEVIRMLQTMFGKDGFRKGLDLYIKRHDGCAVTCDDFIAAMAEANHADLSQFSLWWSQAGTPRVTIETAYDANAKTYTVTASQSIPPTPGQPVKQPMVIPISVGLIDSKGNDIKLVLHGEKLAEVDKKTSRLLVLHSESDSWTFSGIQEKPVLSVGRNFSAPVIFDYDYSRRELAFLACNDSDPFNRAEAFYRLALSVLNEVTDSYEAGQDPVVNDLLVDAFAKILNNDAIAPAYRAVVLEMPSERAIAQTRVLINPEAVHAARLKVIETIGSRLSQDLKAEQLKNQIYTDYKVTPEDAGKRALKNLALQYWLIGGNAKALLTAREQYENADNLTDKLAALYMIVNSQSPAKIDVLNDAGKNWFNEPLLLNKWFTAQATARSFPNEWPVVERVRALMNYEVFSFRNPNNVYALINAFFTQNDAEFHRADGSGYELWKEMVLKLDGINTHVAGRLARALDNWRRYNPERARQMHAALSEVANTPTLSKAVREIVEKALNTH